MDPDVGHAIPYRRTSVPWDDGYRHPNSVASFAVGLRTIFPPRLRHEPEYRADSG